MGVDFVAFDVETAQPDRDSLCAFAVADFAGEGAMYSAIINPGCDFSPYNSAVHGIGAEDVVDAPTVPEIWDDLCDLLSERLVVAHYASFDLSVLRRSAARFGLPLPQFTFVDTWRVSKQLWPGLPSYGLDWVCNHLGIEFLGHHDPRADALAAGDVAVRAVEEANQVDLEELVAVLGLALGSLTPQSYVPCGVPGATGKIDPEPTVDVFDADHPLFGRTLCFTGALASMPRREAAQLVVDKGAAFVNNMSGKVDFLVVGDGDFAEFMGGSPSGKLKKAQELAAKGHPVEVLPERDFWSLYLSG